MLKAGTRRVHAVRVAIYQRSKAQEAATKKTAALSFHSAVRLFVYTFGRFAKGVCIKGQIHMAAFRENALHSTLAVIDASTQ
jgi:hypothetical protein